MIKAGVIGHPIKHSKSPLIHGHWIAQHDLQGTYQAIDIAPESLQSGVQLLIDQGYAGFNVTIPHKETIMELCDKIVGNAKTCGAVNTVVIDEGKIIGHNTDAFGFIANIKQAHPDFDFTSGPAVVLGAGGAARAVVAGLIDEGVPEVIITNRTRARAEKIAEDMSAYTDRISVKDWDDRSEILEGANLLANSSSLGMAGQPALEINLDKLSADALVTDIVYAPLQTDLLKAAAENGNKTVTGIGMLLHQARPAFKEWFGVMPDVDEDLERLVLG
jgi:shikimate dehydrogenase